MTRLLFVALLLASLAWTFNRMRGGMLSGPGGVSVPEILP
jgi:hypothetical protein